MVHEDFNQVAVRPQIDLTFANALRTVLRQDPDIIMVGEIRDTETAEHAVQAALTGHLVLSTLHTNDAPSSITRLLDLGVPALPDHLARSSASSRSGWCAMNCTHCLEEHAPTDEEAAALGCRSRSCGSIASRRARAASTAARPATSAATASSRSCRSPTRFGPDRGRAGRRRSSSSKAARTKACARCARPRSRRSFRGVTTVTEMVRVTGK